MSTQKSTFDPFSLLSPASIHSFGLNLYKGAGDIFISDRGVIEVTTEKLYFKHPESRVPVGLAAQWDSEDFYYLVDGATGFPDGDPDDNSFSQTLSVASRDDLSTIPVALLDDIAYYDEGDFGDDSELRMLEYMPYVVLFNNELVTNSGGEVWIHGAESGDIEPLITEKRREYITSENNDYWEGVFQYDINEDGTIPAYVPSEYPLTSKSSKDVDGDKIKGTKKDDTLKGTKKDDHLDGKKGDDVLKGKKGDDVLLGKKGFDRLLGRKGGDHLNGGGGDDVLKGGKGADTFKLSKGRDTIIDFSADQGDKIAIPEEFINSFKIDDISIMPLSSTLLPDTSLDPGTYVVVEGYGYFFLSGVDKSFVEQNNADIFVRYA